MPEPDRTVLAAVLAKREQVRMAEAELLERRKAFGRQLAEARKKGWSTRTLAVELDVSPGRIQQYIEVAR